MKERSPERTSSGQHLSPKKSDRPPLANISAKMQSPSSKQQGEDEGKPAAKPPQQPEFGKASPLRNPLQRQQPSIFIPKKPVPRPQGQNPMYQPRQAQLQGRPADGYEPPQASNTFYMPGHRPAAPVPQYSSALDAAQAFTSHSYARGFDSDSVRISQPTNAPRPNMQPPPKPTFSSMPSNSYYQPPPPPKPLIDLTKNHGEEDTFDPDAAIRAESRQFGEPDPYMYVDSAQANENIKNLLEGAFDDEEDKSKTRLRKRAKKALAEGKDKEAKGLAAKLASLDVKDIKEEEAKEDKPVEAEGEEEEDGTVEGLAVKLLPHQVEGVAWMIDKEIGQRKRNGVLPHGGILADDMGLGKTIQSISLILTNARPGPDAKPEHPKQKMPGKEVGKSTLVVAPLALIKQWEDEIKTKVSRSHALRVLVHHGPSRTKSAYDLKKYDVVITTYQTLTSEHAGSNLSRPDGARIGCFGVHWYRIVLDEAHSIKNRNAKSTLAACTLESWYRWCLTGTPMQNNLDELQSLIKFLRIKPYCELAHWKQSITGPMKNGRGGLAMRRLQFFLRAFMKRRTKDILKKEGALNFGGKAAKEGENAEKKEGMRIVKREVVTVECSFDEAEQVFYERLQSRADQRLEAMAKKGKNDYIGALVLLLRLRQACNHARLVEMAMYQDKDSMAVVGAARENGGVPGLQTPRKQSRVDDGEMDDLAAMMGGVTMQAMQCDVCQADLNADEARDGASRCGECEQDLAMLRTAGKKTKKDSKPKVVNKENKKEVRRQRPRRIVDDSDDDEDDNAEGEGEWIANGPERHIDLGKAGGTDDEDAEGGGETLDSIDSERSVYDDSEAEDSPSRAHRRQRKVKVEDSDNDSEALDASSDSADSDPESDAAADDDLLWIKPAHKKATKPSTKIRRLLRILHAEKSNHKTIVFSQFTTMLDLIEPHLEISNIRYARYDGGMRNDAREASLNKLRNDAKCRVLLCSLKCGSLGLNLTAASRVVIVEPFWNPFVEEQAIDRVHRLNQTVDVKVYRLTIAHSVESRILELQEKKRELAKAAIEGGKAVGKLSMQDILSLFRHDAEYSGAHGEKDGEYAAKFGGDARLLDGPSVGHEGVGGVMGSQGGYSSQRRGGRVVSGGGEGRRQEHAIYGRRW